MGAHAVRLLRDMWSGLEIHRVEQIRVTADIYPGELWGRTTTGIFFEGETAEKIFPKRYAHFQFGEDWAVNRTSIRRGEAPEIDTLVCGESVGPRGSKRFRNWFRCDEKFQRLLDIIRNGTNLSEDALAIHFLNDTYWGLLRLLLFDNVEAFAACARISPGNGAIRPRDIVRLSKEQQRVLANPAFGMNYQDMVIDWHGMRLPTTVSQVVHEWSWRLEAPEWWDSYREMMGQFLQYRQHPAPGEVCRACMAERPNWSSEGWPYSDQPSLNQREL